jgi:hypothetical protein
MGPSCVVARGGPLIRHLRAFIDLHRLQSALDRLAGHRFQLDWPAFARWLATDAQESATGVPKGDGSHVDGVHVYVQPERMRSPAAGGEGHVAGTPAPRSDLPLILIVVATSPGECHACDRAGTGACLRCRGNTSAGPQAGVTDAMVSDLLRLNREGGLDHVVIVSEDNRLIPVVRFLQTKGTVAIHGWFPPRAIDLSQACDAFIDLGAHWTEFGT